MLILSGVRHDDTTLANPPDTQQFPDSTEESLGTRGNKGTVGLASWAA